MFLDDALRSKEHWARVLQADRFHELLAIYEKRFQEDKQSVFTAMRYSDRILHDAVGTREEFEKPYFARRRFTVATAILALAYPENAEYLKYLQDIVWATCEEYAWAVPAHTTKEKPVETFIDLFAAETAGMLAEFTVLFADRFDEAVLEKIRSEMDRRVFNSFESRRFWWEWATNNWAVVCMGNVAISMLRMRPELFEKHKERILAPFNSYLNAFPEDGTCLEGINYWHFGFGSFVWAADVVKECTNGEINFFQTASAKAVAGYPQRSFLSGGIVASIADGNEDAAVDAAMLGYLHATYPDEIYLLPKKHVHFMPGNVGWLQASRTFVYGMADFPEKEMDLKDYDLLSAGQVFVHKDRYSLFVKAGHNGEPHNHNDVGEFILANKNGQVFCDIGAGRYLSAYFVDETRYTFINNASWGHNVPIIDGMYQKAGKEYCGQITREGNVISVEFSKAYGLENIRSLKRSFTYLDDSIELVDEIDGEYQSFVERFVSRKKPNIGKDFIEIDGVKLHFMESEVSLSIKESDYEPHGDEKDLVKYGKKKDKVPVWLVDFTVQNKIKRISFRLEV